MPLRCFFDDGTQIGSFTNNGSVVQTQTNGNTIDIYGTARVESIVNDGQILGNRINNAGSYVFGISGYLGSLQNTKAGSITATTSSGGILLASNGFLGVLNNAGSISVAGNAVVVGGTTRLGVLNNSGTIDAGIAANYDRDAIYVAPGASIGSIINSGTIDHSGQRGGMSYAAINNEGSIAEIVNAGNLTPGHGAGGGYGIINSGQIGLLANGQGNLACSGILPVKYNAIVGQMNTHGREIGAGGRIRIVF